jgi:hypothetical protein
LMRRWRGSIRHRVLRISTSTPVETYRGIVVGSIRRGIKGCLSDTTVRQLWRSRSAAEMEPS